MTDQQRADTIGKFAGNVEVTPNWNRLKDESTSFNIAYNSCPLCVPSRTSLATGLTPLSNGMMLNDLAGKHAKDFKPIHEILYENGYEVAHVGVNHISLLPKLENRIPFSKFIDDAAYSEYASSIKIDIRRKDFQCDHVQENCEGVFKTRPYSNTKVAKWEYGKQDFKDVWFTDEAISFIKTKHERPFALFVCLWAPHPPLTVPEEYLKMFPPEVFQLPESTGRPNRIEPDSYKTGAPRQLAANPPDKGWQEAWSAHCALSRLCDEQLGRIIEALKKEMVYDDTVIVCTTDHGEQLGEHAMYQKMEMYESAVRVPAIFKIPHGEKQEFDTPVSHLDFFPTVLDLLDINIPYSEGISLANSIKTGFPVKKRDIFSIYCGNHSYGDMRRMIVEYPYKLIYDGKDMELFNLGEDPHEIDNLIFKEPDKAQHLRSKLEKWSKEHDDIYVKY